MRRLSGAVWRCATVLFLLVVAVNLMASDCGNVFSYQYTVFNQQYPQWSPDGDRIVLATHGGIYVVEGDGSSNERVVDSKPLSRGGLHGGLHSPSISPNGARILYSRQHKTKKRSNYELETVAIDGSNQTRLTETETIEIDATWSPDGSRIAYLSDRLAHEEYPKGPISYEFTVFTMAADGSDVRSLAPGVSAKDGVPPVWSPDGRRIAFVSSEKVPADPYPYVQSALYVVGTDGSDPIRLSVTVSQPAWSPDGKSLAFLKFDDGRVTINTINPDGSGLREIAGIEPDAYSWFQGGRLYWSPDGSEIRYGGRPIIVAKAEGEDVQVFEEFQHIKSFAAAWSPEGSRVAVRVGRTENAPVRDRRVVLFSMLPNGSDKRVLIQNTMGPEGLVAGEGVQWEPVGGWGPRSEALPDQPGEPLLAFGPKAVEPCTSMEESTASCQERDVGDVNMFDAGWGGAGYDVDLDIPSVEEILEKGMMRH